MRQRLALAAALLGDPELLILDEPANGLDPDGVRWLRDFLRDFAATGGTVLVSSHHLAEVAQTVDRVVVIHHGRLVAESPLRELTDRLAGMVRVEVDRPAALEMALRSAQVGTTERITGGLLVHGATAAQVGAIAHAADVELRQLVTERASLEDVFLELTAGPARMTGQLRSELLKLRTTRAVRWAAARSRRADAVRRVREGLTPSAAELAARDTQRSMFSAGVTAILFSTLAGLLAVTSEFRYGTIRPTLLVQPRRRVVLGAEARSRPRSSACVFAVACVAVAVRRRSGGPRRARRRRRPAQRRPGAARTRSPRSAACWVR